MSLGDRQSVEILSELLNESNVVCIGDQLKQLLLYKREFFKTAPFQKGDCVIVKKPYDGPGENFARAVSKDATGVIGGIDFVDGRGWQVSFQPNNEINHFYAGLSPDHFRLLKGPKPKAKSQRGVQVVNYGG